METRKRLAKIVLVFVGLFAVCWLPNHVLYMYRTFNYHKIDPSVGHMVITLLARVLSFSNSCVNPFALYFLSESFRRHFNSQLCCCNVHPQPRPTSYLNNSSAIRMSSLENHARHTVAITTLLNGHTPKPEMSLWLTSATTDLKKILIIFLVADLSSFKKPIYSDLRNIIFCSRDKYLLIIFLSLL